MKKKCDSGGFRRLKLLQSVLKMKFLFLFVLLSMQLSATTYSQNARLSLSYSDVLLTDVLAAIRSQSNYTFVYNMGRCEKCSDRICEFCRGSSG